MKVIIINGSIRINGATGKILTKIKENLLEMDSDIVIDYINLGNMNIHYCSGCHSCYKNGSCYIKEDEMENLSQMISECDGIVFGSPTYASNVSGQFKTFIDRGHFVFEQLLRNKACFSIVTYKNYGGKKAQKVINDLIRFSGGAISSKLLLKSNFNNNEIDENQNKYIEKLCRRFFYKAKQRNPLSLFERIFRWVIFNVGIKPYVFKNEQQYKGVINGWIKRSIISEGGVINERL